MSIFKVGDVVRLKSGGPAMVVREANTNYVICVYTDVFGDIKDVSMVSGWLTLTMMDKTPWGMGRKIETIKQYPRNGSASYGPYG